MLMFDNIFSADLQAFCLQVFDWTSHSIFLPSTHQCCGLWLLLLCSVSRFGPRHLLFYLHTPEAWTVIILLACCQHASVSNPVSAWTHSCTAWALWLHCSVYTCRGRIQLPCIWAASNWTQVQVLAWTYQDTSPCSWLSLETLPG